MTDNLSTQFDRVIDAEVQALVAEHIPSDEEYVITLAAGHTDETIELTRILSREQIDAIRHALE